MTQWADYFPEIPNVRKTHDERIFKTSWKKKNGVKICMYFACPVMGTGLSVTIHKPWATDSTKKEEEAMEILLSQVLYYEEHGVWKKEEEQLTNENSPQNKDGL